MSKKKIEKEVINNVDVDALVDEGKKIDTIKVAEVFADKIEDKAKEVQTEETTANAVEDNKTTNDSNETDTKKVPEGIKDVEDVETKEDDNIDDVITECTGKIEENKEDEKPKEPWYIARAKRINDYYNW